MIRTCMCSQQYRVIADTGYVVLGEDMVYPCTRNHLLLQAFALPCTWKIRSLLIMVFQGITHEDTPIPNGYMMMPEFSM